MSVNCQCSRKNVSSIQDLECSSSSLRGERIRSLLNRIDLKQLPTRVLHIAPDAMDGVAAAGIFWVSESSNIVKSLK